jgi:hypothetical protein
MKDINILNMEAIKNIKDNNVKNVVIKLMIKTTCHTKANATNAINYTKI